MSIKMVVSMMRSLFFLEGFVKRQLRLKNKAYNSYPAEDNVTQPHYCSFNLQTTIAPLRFQ